MPHTTVWRYHITDRLHARDLTC